LAGAAIKICTAIIMYAEKTSCTDSYSLSSLWLQLSDDELASIAAAAVQRHLGIVQAPHSYVTTWKNRLPLYSVGHQG
jgi:protoporphyrinogen oxidase